MQVSGIPNILVSLSNDLRLKFHFLITIGTEARLNLANGQKNTALTFCTQTLYLPL